MEPALTEEEERFTRWLEQGDEVIGHLQEDCTVPLAWQDMRREAKKLGDLLRGQLQSAMELPDPVAFNFQIRQRIG